MIPINIYNIKCFRFLKSMIINNKFYHSILIKFCLKKGIKKNKRIGRENPHRKHPHSYHKNIQFNDNSKADQGQLYYSSLSPHTN